MPDIGAYLWPDSVAIIGASPDVVGIRGRLTEIVLQHPYEGEIHLVSRSNDEIEGRRTYTSIADVPGHVDLAMIVVPAKFVVGEVEACARAGVKAILIVSSGFAEASGEEGAAMQAEIVRITKAYDIALAGPNCQGFANTQNNLFATFSRPFNKPELSVLPKHRSDGHVAIVSQSGGIGNAIYHHARVREVPASYVATTGNEAGIEMFDLVDDILDRGDTSAILVFMEDIKNAETFRRAADKALRAGTPIIVIKIGKSEAGQRAAASHTAALAGSYSGFQAIFRQYGIIEVSDIGEMADIANGFSYYGKLLPKGHRVAIVTGSGGGGGFMADACELAGLEVPPLDAATRARLDAEIPDYGTSQNPVDATATALRAIGFSGLISRVQPSSEIDAIMAVASTRVTGAFEMDFDKLKRVAAELEKPVLVWSYNVPKSNAAEYLSEIGLPLYTDIRNCARTLKVMADYHAFRETYLAADVAAAEIRIDRACAAEALAAKGETLTEFDSRPILAAYGICDGEVHLARSAGDATEIQKSLGGKVALKVQSPEILHKSDAGALTLDLGDADAVAAGFERVMQGAVAHKPDASIQGVLVQPMAPKGVEVILGVSTDETFGPMLMVGLGGIFVEVLQDVAFAPVPLNAAEARALLQRLRGYKLLEGARGGGAADIDALAGVMVRLSRFAADFRESVAEVDLNPVIVHPAGQGVSVADALIVKHKAGYPKEGSGHELR